MAAYIRLLRRKLKFNHSNPLIETIYGVGYRLNISPVFDSMPMKVL
ncbi:MAG: winged helix-turn-helix domain-containing protein [Rhizonema sp. PD38]|nr:winged helix-turn-helix domain-containing protein [Rhizonema sp. PD38]